MNTRPTVTLLACIALALAGFFSGCGDDDPAPAKPQGTNKKQPKEAAKPFPADKAVGMIRGNAAWQGDIPSVKKIVPPEVPFCEDHADKLIDESLLVNANNTVKNVFVYIKSGLADYDYAGYTGRNAPSQAREVDQVFCVYVPHVFGIMVGQEMKVKSSDNTMHNVHFVAKYNEEFNIPQKLGDLHTANFGAEEVMARLECNVHSWMKSYVGILRHPFYAVTGEDGSFEIGKLPPGTYELEAWHETLGRQTQKVIITDSDAPEVVFTFKK